MMTRKAAVWIVLGWAGAAQAEPVVIAALGDSLTAGYGLATDDGFVPQLQAWLMAEGLDASIMPLSTKAH